MKRPAVFFDRDNTLIVGNEYLGDPEQVMLMEGAADAVSRARALGYATVIFSNQSGVARGMFDEAAVRAVNWRVEEYLRDANPNAIIDRQEYCPFHPEGTVDKYCQESDLRKPRPGMILRAAERLALDLSRSWVIGDAPRDIEAGHAAGCRTILFQAPDVDASPAAMERCVVEPDYTCDTLAAAMDYVAEHGMDETLPDPPTTLGTAATSAAPRAMPPLPGEESHKTAGNQLDSISVHRLERLCEQIIEELKRSHDQPADFSISKLFAGITQILAVSILFVSYLNRNNDSFYGLLFCAQFIQLMTIALLIMGKQR
jgi:histidinol-phosphate phosphatase family protein